MATIASKNQDDMFAIPMAPDEMFEDRSSFARFVKANFNKLPTPLSSSDSKPQENNVSFGRLRQDGKPRRPYLRLDGRRKDEDFFKNVYDLLTQLWNLPEPDYILELTGSSEDLVLDADPSRHADKMNRLKQYVRKLVDNDEGRVTWVISGGSDSGHMSLVGEALADLNHIAPIIAITPWGPTLAEKANLERGAVLRSVNYQPRRDPQISQRIVNMDHSCFLFVDVGQEDGGWGYEIDFRNSFVDYVSRQRFNEKLPVLLLLIGGGPMTLKTAHKTVAASFEDLNLGRYVEPRPLIILSSTTRSANAIEFALNTYRSDDATGQQFAEAIKAKGIIDSILTKPKDRENPVAVAEAIDRLRAIAMRKHLITVVNAFHEDSSNLRNLFEIRISTPEQRTQLFVDDNFDHKRCASFFPIEDSQLSRIEGNMRQKLLENGGVICRCGRSDHPSGSGESGPNWDNTQRSGTLFFEKHPEANAANLLEFVPSYSKFIRLPFDQEASPVFMEKVSSLMFEFWRMQRPQMLIEITGSATDMRLNDHAVLKSLKIGLVRVAKKAKAWLIAGGTNSGIMKLVGDAVAEDRKTHGGSGVHCLGIAPYGMLENRHDIFDKSKIGPTSLVRYPYKNDTNYAERSKLGNPYELNPGYDYYILVDTGKENRFGEEIAFRAQLLGYLSDLKPYKTKTDSNKTPLVLLVVGGGPGTLQTIVDAVKVSKDTRPIVILKGFGGVGDFLASAQNRLHDPTLKLEPLFKSLAAKKGDQGLLDELKLIFANEDLTTVVDMSSKEAMAQQSLEDAIIQAIFKVGPGGSNDPNNWIKSSFELAIKWDHIDGVKKFLFDAKAMGVIRSARLGDDSKGALLSSKAMTFAIKRDQAKLFEIYIKTGLIEPRAYFFGDENDHIDKFAVILHKLFWHPSSWNSHKKVVPSRTLHFFQHLLESKHKEAKVGKALSFRFNYDAADAGSEQLLEISDLVEPVFRALLQLPASLNSSASKFYKELRQKSPKDLTNDDKDLMFQLEIRNLFLLKLLLCRDDFAVAIWSNAQISDYLGSAVMAVIVLEQLAAFADSIHRRDLCERYKELAECWEQRSLAVIQKLSDSQARNMAPVLTRTLRTWHGTNVLQMAYCGDRLQIMSHSAVQIELEKVWKGSPASESEVSTQKQSKGTSPQKTFAGLRNWCGNIPDNCYAFFNRKHNKHQPTNSCCPIGGKPKVGPIKMIDSPEAKHSKRQTSHSVRGFYQASPRVKFTFYTISLLVFLLILFGDVIVTAHKPLKCYDNGPSPQLIYLWIAALMFTADTFHEIQIFDRVTIDNMTTICGGVLMLTSFVLRMVCCYGAGVDDNHPLLFEFSRIFHAISCIFFWFKSFRLLFVFKSLGPLVITLYEMFKDVAFFAILHFIILFAFAGPIYTLAVMPQTTGGNANANDYFAQMARIIYQRWWNIVGINMEAEFALGESCSKRLNPLEQFDETPDLANPENGTSFFGELSTTMAAVVETSSLVSACDFRNVISSILLMVFLLLTNIVLLNMLIAIFSFTVTEYHEKASVLWKFGRYHLIRSFAEKPILPPPFNIFELIIFNPRVLGSCTKQKHWSNSLETKFIGDSDSLWVHESNANDATNWKNKYELAAFRYRELNGIEKTAVSKVLDAEMTQ